MITFDQLTLVIVIVIAVTANLFFVPALFYRIGKESSSPSRPRPGRHRE